MTLLAFAFPFSFSQEVYQIARMHPTLLIRSWQRRACSQVMHPSLELTNHGGSPLGQKALSQVPPHLAPISVAGFASQTYGCGSLLGSHVG